METRGYMEYEFEVEPPPEGKGCTISPTSGRAVFTGFNIKCEDYVDTVAGLPLVYHLVQKEHVLYHSDEFYSLIAYGGEPILSNITLSSPDVGSTTTIYLKMRVINVKGSAAEVNLTVQLEVGDQKDIVDDVLNSSMLQKSQDTRQENVRSVTNIATVISKDSTASKQRKIIVRNRLLRNLENFDSKTADSVEHTSLALEKSSEKEDEFEMAGLDSGLTAGEKLTKHVGKVSNQNFEKVQQVARLLVFAVSRFLSVATVAGLSALKGPLSKEPDKDLLVQKNKDQSTKGVSSMDNVAEVLARNIQGTHQRLDVNTDHVDIGVEMHSTPEESSFELGREKQASFHLPTVDTGVLDGEDVQGAFQVFDKNPYAYATENVHGDLPVIKVDFVRKEKLQDAADIVVEEVTKPAPSTTPKHFRFNKPADIFLDFNSSTSEELDYPVIIDVEKERGVERVVKSSCILMSIAVSREHVTVLEVRSRDDLKLKVHMRYTSDRSPFSGLSMFSNTSLLHCRCVVAAAYTGSYLVMPRLINPLDVGLFLNFFENPIAVSSVIAIWMIFAASFIWGKLKDDKDVEA
ncbi:polycystic kidney disease and receptor for egg jelly-related protein, partial [Elysia marginata]